MRTGRSTAAAVVIATIAAAAAALLMEGLKTTSGIDTPHGFVACSQSVCNALGTAGLRRVREHEWLADIAYGLLAVSAAAGISLVHFRTRKSVR